MPATDLRFLATQPASLDLQFGLIPGAEGGYVDLTITAVLPANVAATVSADVDMAVNRAPGLRTAGGWQDGTRVVSAVVDRFERKPTQQADVVQAVTPAAPMATSNEMPWGDMPGMACAPRSLWGGATQRPEFSTSPFGDLNHGRRTALSSIFQNADRVGGTTDGRWKVLGMAQRPVVRSGTENAKGKSRYAAFAYSPAKRTDRIRIFIWGGARPPQAGVSPNIPGTVIPPSDPCYQPARGDRVGLLFSDRMPASLDLLFRCKASGGPVATIVVPVRRIYMQSNTVTLALADTGQPIPADRLNLSIDVDSWCWGWSATVPAGYLSLLQTDDANSRVELLATVNGTSFRLAVEKIGRSRSFGKSSLAISGRGRAAWLDSPYATVASRSNGVAMTAQQLMEAALTENGVSLGWSLDWRITDWLVPAGAWQHTGSAMSACQAIAGAAGAYIQAHRSDQTLIILPRYEVAPWNWPSATPDIDLPESVVTVEGVEWSDKPDYNTVFIAGQTDGILGHVTRSGTAGDKAAPMVCDPLITHADAARQRGTAILGNTGRQKLITLSLPILPETGIIVPGKLMRYSESGRTHLGMTRAVEVDCDFPKARQFITLESHVI